MRRREFITLVGGAIAAGPLVAHAQRAMPTIGFLDPRSPDGLTDRLRGLRQGLKETGFSEGENVTIEYRWAENQIDRLPDLAADLVRRRVAVLIASGGRDSALAAKGATTAIPILFIVAEDPVRLELVGSIARPSGNATGVNFFNAELGVLMIPIGIIELISEIIKPFTLAIRLFGNIFGEDVIVVVLSGLLAGSVVTAWMPIQFPILVLALLTSFVQAMVFSILACIYLSLATSHEH